MMLQTNTWLLRLSLYLNAIFSFISALEFMIFPGIVSGYIFSEKFVFLGYNETQVVFVTGVGLLLFVGLIGLAISRSPDSNELATCVTGLDYGWVLGTLVVLVFAGSVFTTVGIAVAIVTAVAVATFATGQTLGLLAHRQTAS